MHGDKIGLDSDNQHDYGHITLLEPNEKAAKPRRLKNNEPPITTKSEAFKFKNEGRTLYSGAFIVDVESVAYALSAKSLACFPVLFGLLRLLIFVAFSLFPEPLVRRKERKFAQDFCCPTSWYEY
jgi:hypothetical protein